MLDPKQILVVIDDFQESEPLIDYLAGLTDIGSAFHIHLFHAGGPLPPGLLESPGAEGPDEERKVERKQEEAQDRWCSRLKEETARYSMPRYPDWRRENCRGKTS